MKDLNLDLKDDKFLIYYMVLMIALKDVAKSKEVQKNIDEFLNNLENFDKKLLKPEDVLEDLKDLIKETIASLDDLESPPPEFLNIYHFFNDFLEFTREMTLEEAFEELQIKPARLLELFSEIDLDVKDERLKSLVDLFDLSEKYKQLLSFITSK